MGTINSLIKYKGKFNENDFRQIKASLLIANCL